MAKRRMELECLKVVKQSVSLMNSRREFHTDLLLLNLYRLFMRQIFCVLNCSGHLMQDSRVASLEKDLRESKDELIRLRSINLSVNKDQLESLKIREAQLKDKV